MNTRRILIVAMSAAALAIVCAGGFLLWQPSPPPDPTGGSAAGTASGQSSAAMAPAGDGNKPSATGESLPLPPEVREHIRVSEEMAAKMASGTATPPPDTQTAFIAEARRRAAEDPKAAFAWAFQQGDLARIALDVVLESWGRTDPAAAFEALRETPQGADPMLRAVGLAHVTERWSTADPAAAWKALETLPPSIETGFLKVRAADEWAKKDFSAAAAILKTLASGGRNREEQVLLLPAFASVAEHMARRDGAKAAEWATGFAEGSPERANAVAGVVSGWYGNDAKAVGDWLNGIEEGAARDAGAATLVNMCLDHSPEVALEWAQTISNEAQRSVMIANAAGRWLFNEPEKAEAWMQKTTVLTTEQKELALANDRPLRELRNATRDKR